MLRKRCRRISATETTRICDQHAAAAQEEAVNGLADEREGMKERQRDEIGFPALGPDGGELRSQDEGIRQRVRVGQDRTLSRA
ncbi:hypothetical protein [Methylobacterium soli]|uniref:Uncharacterized protein n=1 Tax=Methylobacterium soli TaxID=553447 RepID=A0A6L3SUA5_9HYPH|nr:hypothetical protein [Methylobacterium soli]KAB1074967.1 hypothetical protein F6X53_25275 [Methylobacterium soli]GJE45647.1 hypothetical protein AEGHOMDF_4847 [Methylobacterium soli]